MPCSLAAPPKLKHILRISQFTREDLESIFQIAYEMKNNEHPQCMQGKILSSCFFEPSTRTRLSFESAMIRLGGQAIGFSDSYLTSSKKGESLYDTIKVIGEYADVIVLRHPLEGSAARASEATHVPLINGGDGANQHPTQTLVDLFTIHESFGTLDGIKVAFCGDLKYGRTVHSLAEACAHFDMRLYFVSPQKLTLPQEVCDTLRKKTIMFSFHRTLEEVLSKVDVLYMTRMQLERFAQDEKLSIPYLLNKKMLDQTAQPHLKVLHPLPRVDEISRDIDGTDYAKYFNQAKNGIPVRQSLLFTLLGATV